MTKKTILFSALVFLFSLMQINAQSPEKHINKDKKNRAVQGYDVVSYFNDSEPSKGNSKYTTDYNKSIYLFKDAKNKELFIQTPSKYTPQYGGWCAYAMGAKGEKVAIDADTYKIVEDKLYLFYNTFIINTLPMWNEDEVNLKSKADKNWSNIIK